MKKRNLFFAILILLTAHSALAQNNIPPTPATVTSSGGEMTLGVDYIGPGEYQPGDEAPECFYPMVASVTGVVNPRSLMHFRIDANGDVISSGIGGYVSSDPVLTANPPLKFPPMGDAVCYNYFLGAYQSQPGVHMPDPNGPSVFTDVVWFEVDTPGCVVTLCSVEPSAQYVEQWINNNGMTVGVEESSMSTFNVFSSTTGTITVEASAGLRLLIVSSSGQIIHDQKLQSDKDDINVDIAGLYIVQVYHGESVTGKIVAVQ